ncbi:hypothetical protein T484DRAFT_1885337 [Baffinella frigidus]|nr:hypothetical protein T484DRAFT_1885337 [Cryptophyta sp. CCMP2293]
MQDIESFTILEWEFTDPDIESFTILEWEFAQPGEGNGKGGEHAAERPPKIFIHLPVNSRFQDPDEDSDSEADSDSDSDSDSGFRRRLLAAVPEETRRGHVLEISNLGQVTLFAGGGAAGQGTMTTTGRNHWWYRSSSRPSLRRHRRPSSRPSPQRCQRSGGGRGRAMPRCPLTGVADAPTVLRGRRMVRGVGPAGDHGGPARRPPRGGGEQRASAPVPQRPPSPLRTLS